MPSEESLATAPARPAFGIVIPTLEEARTIARTVRHVRDEAWVADVVVVDCGSRDATVEEAQRAGARILFAPPGRGTQMNRGACAVGGDVLVFLHADCRLPAGAFEAMTEVLGNGRDAGLFAIDYDSRNPLLRLASRLSRLRAPWTEFGEGALFIDRRRFEALGGFPDWPLFEDVELLARLRRSGSLGRARGRVRASARRYRRRGPLRQLLLNAFLYTLFRCGVSPRRLLQLYGGAGAAARVGARGSLRRRLRHPGARLYGSRCLESPLRRGARIRRATR